MLKQEQNDGISLLMIHFVIILGVLVFSCLMFYSTYHLSNSFRYLAKTAEQQIELRKAARELMDASDYLTENVQRFTINGDMRFLDEYFIEAFAAKHREEAIARMSEEKGSVIALQKLQNAMDNSMRLMNQEYYAMRLVIEAKGFTEYPNILKSVRLSDKDQALAPEEKMRHATELVLGDDYYNMKLQIRNNMRICLSELERMAYDTDASELATLHDEMTFIRVVIALQIIAVFLMVWLTFHLGIQPILNAVNHIKENKFIPELGANEFRYLASAYNKMYGVYKNSLERLNFKVSHDELTGAYNRYGYELLLYSVDLMSTYMVLLDVDDFKNINDTYGHETGDKILIKLVQVLKRNFYSDYYICRLGGDEFVVFVVHSSEMERNLIASKLEKVNVELADSDDGLPAVSISIGIVHAKNAINAEDLFNKTDIAMYKAKQGGKNTYAFYSR